MPLLCTSASLKLVSHSNNDHATKDGLFALQQRLEEQATVDEPQLTIDPTMSVNSDSEDMSDDEAEQDVSMIAFGTCRGLAANFLGGAVIHVSFEHSRMYKNEKKHSKLVCCNI